jgi:hypothetical protein
MIYTLKCVYIFLGPSVLVEMVSGVSNVHAISIFILAIVCFSETSNM